MLQNNLGSRVLVLGVAFCVWSCGGSGFKAGGRSTGGTTGAAGGVSATGGTTAAGGASDVGAASATGGTSATAGGTLGTGGTGAAGGVPATGGSATTGGSISTGGASAAGGTSATAGGTLGTGGTRAAGGAFAAGGSATTGGSISTGGASAAGGATGTSAMTLAEACSKNCALASGLPTCSTTTTECEQNCMTTYDNTSALGPRFKLDLGGQYTAMMACIATNFTSSSDFVCASRPNSPDSPLNKWSPVVGPSTGSPCEQLICDWTCNDLCDHNCDDSTHGDIDPWVFLLCTCGNL
jgi:hypothetical protein